jgi:hypothetical protein
MNKKFFKLPGLFEKFDLIKKVIEVYNAYPFIFKKGYIIDSVYGSNGGNLNGGRAISECKHNIKDILSFCEQNKVFPTIIMSNTLVTYEEAACDAHAINILNNFNIPTTYFCVANNEVEEWLLDKRVASCNIISSTTKCLDEKDLEKEAKEHGLVVLPENLINRFDIISKLPTETRSKLEVIVNSACPLDCIARKKHYNYMSRVALKEEVPKFSCPNYNYAGNGFLYELFNTPQFVSNKMINKYIELGINHFKIQGRTDSDYNLIETFAYYLVKDKYRIMFRELVQQQMDG